MTAKSSHSNDSIHSKLESFGQLQAQDELIWRIQVTYGLD